MQEAAMQEPSRNEAPILAGPNERGVFSAHVHQGSSKKRVEWRLVALTIHDQLKQEERNVDDQKDDAGHIGSRHRRKPGLSAPQVNGARTQLCFAIRADTVGRADKSPAIRAHTALFHRTIVATEKAPA